jgi:hypothetical protein
MFEAQSCVLEVEIEAEPITLPHLAPVMEKILVEVEAEAEESLEEVL